MLGIVDGPLVTVQVLQAEDYHSSVVSEITAWMSLTVSWLSKKAAQSCYTNVCLTLCPCLQTRACLFYDQRSGTLGFAARFWKTNQLILLRLLYNSSSLRPHPARFCINEEPQSSPCRGLGNLLGQMMRHEKRWYGAMLHGRRQHLKRGGFCRIPWLLKSSHDNTVCGHVSHSERFLSSRRRCWCSAVPCCSLPWKLR